MVITDNYRRSFYTCSPAAAKKLADDGITTLEGTRMSLSQYMYSSHAHVHVCLYAIHYE